MLGGDITVESQEGKGSQFTLSIPLESAVDVPIVEPGSLDRSEHKPNNSLARCIDVPADISLIAQEATDDRGDFDCSKKSVLIIDDDKAFSESISKLIRKSDFQVLRALTGGVGLSLAAAFKPTGIILDLGLPDMNGQDVLELLQKDDRTSAIPVHMISAHDHTDEFIEKGASTYTQKPVQQDDIHNLLDELTQLNNAKILVVEDEATVQKRLMQLFTKMPAVEIDFAETAALARSQFAKNKYACLVIDIGLPDGSGLDLIDDLAETDQVMPPLIVFTARELTEDEHKRMKKHTSSIILKSAKGVERLFDEVSLFLHHVELNVPNKPKTKARQKSAVVPDKEYANCRILLVDDDLRNTFALSRAIEAHQLKVTIADNGLLALEILQKEDNIDLVLMDIMMPVMDGFEAIGKIREMERYQEIPIIALTAKATEQDRKKCIDAGASDYMSKPIDVEALMALIRLWLKTSGKIND